MAKVRYPFLYLRPELRLRPYVQVRIGNPDTGLDIETLALVDTGADFVAIPGWIATATGHKLGAGMRAARVTTGAGTCPCEQHTFTVSLLDFNKREFVCLAAAPVQVLPKLSQTLLGVAGCLDRFRLTVDYPGQWFELRG